jgi:hypothetical protein
LRRFVVVAADIQRHGGERADHPAGATRQGGGWQTVGLGQLLVLLQLLLLFLLLLLLLLMWRCRHGLVSCEGGVGRPGPRGHYREPCTGKILKDKKQKPFLQRHNFKIKR